MHSIMDESQKYAEQKRSDSKEYILGFRIYMNFYESKPMYSDISQISDCLKKRRKEFIKQQQEIVYILTGVLLGINFVKGLSLPILKCVNSIVYKLHLNKVDLKEIYIS